MSDRPNARELAARLVGTEALTLDQGRPNRVLGIRGANVIVGTGKSPGGKRVPLRLLQQALDRLYVERRIEVSVKNLGHQRSSFVGAALATIRGTKTQVRPMVIEFDPSDDSLGSEASFEDAPEYADPEWARRVDLAGVEIAVVDAHQRFPKYAVEEMVHNNPGFDLRILDEEGSAIAYVEVKSTSSAEPRFFISENERRFSKEQSDRFHLAVVTTVDPDAGTGLVTWRTGTVDPASDLELRPHQWRGRLTPVSRQPDRG